MDVKASDGNITLERCKGQSISVESDGGEIVLRNVIGGIDLRNENGRIAVESFSGTVNVKSKDTEILLRNSDDAEIHIESDGSDVNIEDCCADVHIDSGKGNVVISGYNLSTGSMGEVELRMKTGDVHLHGRTFEDILIVIEEEGNAEVDMEKLSAGGSGQISVHKGNVTVGVLPDFGCQLTAHGSRKNMHIELPVEIVEKDKNRLCGTLNGGGSRMEVIAPNGEIRFHALESLHTQSNMEEGTANA
jgi:hypothetical protein